MSKSRTASSDTTTTNKEYESSICIASSGNKREIKCNYSNVDFKFSNDEDKSPPEFFNWIANSKEFDFYVFMSKDYDFAYENSINDILAFFETDSNIDAIYTDILARTNGKQALLKPQPMASKYLLNNSVIMNIPFVVKQRAIPHFNENFRHLFLHLGILDTFQKSLIVHCPKFCFTINNFSRSSPELNREMEILKNGK